MTIARAVLLVIGVALVGWGLRLVVGLGFTDLLDAAVWLAAGVLIHDAVVAPAVIILGALVARRLPSWAAPSVAATSLIVGSVTLALLPTLGRFGAKPDDPTLLAGRYGTWWLVLTACAVGAGTASAWRARDRRRRSDDVESSSSATRSTSS
jgi:hypothetical protein